MAEQNPLTPEENGILERTAQELGRLRKPPFWERCRHPGAERRIAVSAGCLVATALCIGIASRMPHPPDSSYDGEAGSLVSPYQSARMQALTNLEVLRALGICEPELRAQYQLDYGKPRSQSQIRALQADRAGIYIARTHNLPCGDVQPAVPAPTTDTTVYQLSLERRDLVAFQAKNWCAQAASIRQAIPQAAPGLSNELQQMVDAGNTYLGSYADCP